MLAKAMKAYWLESVNDTLPALQDAERAAARLCLQSLIGRAVFLSREPAGSHRYQSEKSRAVTELAITIRQVGTGREYLLDNELDNVQPLVEVAMLGRKGPAGAVVDYLWQQVRLATTNYNGDWNYVDDDGATQTLFIHGATIENDSIRSSYSANATNDWDYRLESLWLITHDNAVPGAI